MLEKCVSEKGNRKQEDGGGGGGVAHLLLCSCGLLSHLEEADEDGRCYKSNTATCSPLTDNQHHLTSSVHSLLLHTQITFTFVMRLLIAVAIVAVVVVVDAQRQTQQNSNKQTSSTAGASKAAAGTAEEEPRFLALPDPVKCARRPKEFFFDGHWYFYSGNVTRYRRSEVDWLEARNACREYCMDAVSIESEEENNIIFDLIKDNNLKYIWSSGRLCDFKGCNERDDLQPIAVNGWFWSGSGVKMAPTNVKPKGWTYQPWSYTGNSKKPQPDNAELDINGTPESCLAVLNNVYKDGIHWHDVACYHPKAFVCEDSEELLRYARATNPNLPI